MSVKLMTAVYAAHFQDITFDNKGKTRKVIAPNVKSVALAMADHANDEGEGSYPGIELLSDKTELSENTVVACLRAMKSVSMIQYIGISRYGTNNYTLNKKLISEMANWEKRKGKTPKSTLIRVEAASTQEKNTVETASTGELKPLQQVVEAASTEPSSIIKPPLGANAPALPAQTRRTDAKVLGDPLDGILASVRAAQERAEQEGLPVQVLSALESFPVDCQSGVRLCYEKFRLIPPSKPKSGRGGEYAFWIDGVRELVNICKRYNVDLRTGFDEVFKAWNKNPFDKKSPKSLAGPMISALSTFSVREESSAPTTAPTEQMTFVPPPANKPVFIRPRRAIQH